MIGRPPKSDPMIRDENRRPRSLVVVVVVVSTFEFSSDPRLSVAPVKLDSGSRL